MQFMLFVANSLLLQKAFVCQIFLEAYGVQHSDMKLVNLERKIQFLFRWLL